MGLADALAYYGITLDLPKDGCVQPSNLKQLGSGYFASHFPDGGLPGWEGRTSRGVHVAAWALREGRWPNLGEEVRHLCGNGNAGCCNPHHLDIGSRADNIQDSVRHGVIPNGSRHWNCKLTSADIQQIHSLRAEGKVQREIAAEVGCSQTWVGRILQGARRG